VYDLKVVSAERPRVPLGSRPIRVVTNDLMPMSRSDRSISASSLRYSVATGSCPLTLHESVPAFPKGVSEDDIGHSV